MRIVADKNIPLVAEAFAVFGEVVLCDGRSLTARDLQQADVLLVRSVTAVNATLLDNTPVKFVGSATIGVDHIDQDYLKLNGIEFCHTPGSNAHAVVEYILVALLHLAVTEGCALGDKTVGIIGYGNIGKRLAAALDLLGVQYLLNDPPLAMQDKQFARHHVDLEAIQHCDIISLHVPLTQGGAHPSYHLVDAAFIAALSSAAVLINTSRGAVVDNLALARYLAKPQCTLRTIIDVWEQEPAINTALLAQATLATPHIAGYGLEARLNATQQLYNAVCDYFSYSPVWQYRVDSPLNPCLQLPAMAIAGAISDAGGSVATTLLEQRCLQQLFMQVYDIEQDDQRLRRLLKLSPAEQGAYFDGLRKNYTNRHAFSAYSCPISGHAKIDTLMLGLGFQPT